jgi:hypothetical protein
VALKKKIPAKIVKTVEIRHLLIDASFAWYLYIEVQVGVLWNEELCMYKKE